MTVLATPMLVPMRGLDVIRAWLLRLLGRWLRPALRDRDIRAALTVAITGAFTLTGVLIAPLWWLAFGPLIWGVPHLLSDIRYLLVRQGLWRRSGWLGVAVPAVLAAVLWLGVRATLVGCVLVTLLPIASMKRRLLVGSVALVAALAAIHAGGWADLILAHAHNVLGLGFWCLWRPSRSPMRHLALAMIAVVFAFLLSPAVDVVRAATQSWLAEPATLSWDDYLPWLGAEQLWPEVDGEPSPWPMRLVLWFAFAQSMHYVAWIHLVPSEDRVRNGPRSFVNSARAWARDLGWPLLALGALASVGLLVLATQSLALARDHYFVLASAHGHVELLALAFIALRGIRRAQTP